MANIIDSPAEPSATDPVTDGGMVELISSANWPGKPAGTFREWPVSLQLTIGIMLDSPLPMCIALGQDFFLIYNDAFKKLPGSKTPGAKSSTVFGDTWQQLGPAFRLASNGEKIPAFVLDMYSLANGSGSGNSYNCSITPFRDENGLVAGVIGTFVPLAPVDGDGIHSVPGQPDARQLIRDAEQRSRLAIDAASMGTFDWDLVTRDFTCSPRLAEIFGHDSVEKVDHSILLNGIHPDDRPARDAAVQASFTTGSLQYEARIVMPDKNIHWVKVFGKIVYNELKEPLRMYGMVTDITEEKITLTALEESESRLNIAINASKLATYDVDLTSNKVSGSTRFYEVFDIEPNSVIIRNEILSKIHPDDIALRNKAHETALETGNLEYEARLIWRDKSIHWIKTNGKYLYNDQHQPVRILGTVMDITEQKFHLHELQESEQRFKVIADTAPVMLWMSNLEMLSTFFNKGWLDYTGRTLEQELGNGWLEGVHPDDIEKCTEVFTKAFHEQAEFYMEYRIRRKDGAYRWIADTGIPRIDNNGIFLGHIGRCVDIDEQKLLNEKLAKSEARIRIAALSGELGTWDYNPLTNDLYWDEASSEIFGVDYEQPGSFQTLWHSIHSEDRAIASQKASMALDPEIAEIFEIEFRITHPSDGQLRWVHGKGKAFFENGTPYRFAGTIIDITEKKLALESLKKSELLFKTIANTSPVGLWLTDEFGNNIFLNNTWINWTGIPFEDQIKNGWFQLLAEEDKQNTLSVFEKALQKREKFTSQFRFTNKNNITFWCLTEGYPYYTNDGRFAGYAGSVTDITEQLTAMDALKKSEGRFRLLANAMPQFIWTADPVGYLNYFNQAIYDYTGFTEDTVYDQGWFSIIHPDDRDLTIERWVKSIKAGTDFSCEHRYKRHDGVYRWQLSRALPQRDINGIIQLWIGSSTDIHDQKLAAEELENKVKQRTAELQKMNDEIIQQKEFVEIILDSSLIMVTVFDSEKRIISYNKKCEEVFNNKKEDVLGQEYHVVFPGIELSQTYRNLELALAGESIHVSNYKSVVNNHYYESYFVPLKDKNNYVYAVLMTAHDITDIVHSTERVQEAYSILEEQNKALERSNEELESFSYVASHDLQEPLRKIQTFIELLHRNLHDKEASEKYFIKITSSAQRMASLIRDVLNYSRLARQGEPFSPVDLNLLMEELTTDFELLILEKKAKVIYQQLPVVKGIPLQLNQLFTNLLSNALKFSEKEPEIRILSRTVSAAEVKKLEGLTDHQSYIQISFIDNGIGFEQQFAEKIFTIFQRLNSRGYSGTGIGLALCKKIVENHKGIIVAESEPGVGSSFHVYLPLSD